MSYPYHIPHLMSIREAASTGILPENAIRTLVRTGQIPVIRSGGRAYLNFENLCKQLSLLGAIEEDKHVN